MTLTTRKMSDRHEEDLLTLLGGRGTPNSGATWRAPMDGRTSRHEASYAFAWDGKSTLSKSVGVSRAMWDKAVEQAGGERPLLPLRFYDNERLDVGLDLVVLSLHDFVEILEIANRPDLADCAKGLHNFDRPSSASPGTLPCCTRCGNAPYEAGGLPTDD